MNLKRTLPATALLLAMAGGSGAQSAAGPTNAVAAETQQPVLSEHQQMQSRRGPRQFTFSEAEGAVIRLWKPDLTTLPLEAKMGVVTIPSTGVDNYHAIVAEKDWGYLKEAIIRYEYLRGKPSGESPTRLTTAEKTDFEVVPEPIPREHYHYHSDQTWEFLLRFKQTPVPGVAVIMETANGSRVRAVSNSDGVVRLHIPDDFDGIVDGERDRRTAEFTVSAEYHADGTDYQTLLSAEYRVNPQHWNALGLGISATLIGLLAGIFIGRIRRAGESA